MRGYRRSGRIRCAAILLLIVGLADTPLPMPDYHPLADTEDLGQVCTRHDHLLAWHPEGEAPASEGSVFHWHWTPWLTSSEADDTPGGDSTDTDASALGDLEPFVPVLAGAWSHRVRRFDPGWSTPIVAATGPIPQPAVGRAPRPRSFAATFAPYTALAPLWQRWVC